MRKGLKLKKINFVMPDRDLPKGTGWHLQSKTVIPDLFRNLQTLFQNISMQRVENSLRCRCVCKKNERIKCRMTPF